MDTRKAFEKLLSDRDRCEKIGISKETRRTYKFNLKNGTRSVSIDLMESWLIKAGFIVALEKQWVDRPADQSDTAEYTSEINYLSDMPLDYFDTFEDWNFLHSHMFSNEVSYMDKIRAYDIYLKKLKAEEDKKQASKQ